MDEMTWHIVSRCLRAVLYNHAALIFMLYLCDQACGYRPRRRRVLWAIIEARMVMDLCVLEVLAVTCGQERWYPLLWAVDNLVHTCMTLPIMHNFQGHLGKTILAAMWTETFAVGCQMGAWALAYWGTGEMYTMTSQPLHPRDARMVMFYVPICWLCALALRPALGLYRRYEFQHPGLLQWAAVLVVFSRVYTNIYAAMPQGSYLMTSYLVIAELLVFVLAFFLIKRERMRKQIYMEQQRSVETHLALLREQAAQMAKNREQMEERIALVESVPWEERAALAGQYLKELKEQYSAFLSQVRCRDPLVDALLSYRQTLCGEKGISAEFSLENYGRGGLEEQEVAALLLYLLDWAMENCLRSKNRKEIALSISLVKGQLLVEVSSSGRKKLTREGLGLLLSQHDGALTQERTEDGWRVRVLMEASDSTDSDGAGRRWPTDE